MKKLTLLFAAVMMFASFGAVKAQKIASLDVAAVLNMMPEMKKADEQLTAFSKAKQAEIEKQAQSFQTLVQKYQAEAPKQTAEVNKTREAEITKLQQNLQQLNLTAQKDLATRRDAAFAPIEKKFYDAVAKVAKANGWDFVFDTNNPALVYKGGADATAAVRKELGL